jgi:N-acetyltransferase
MKSKIDEITELVGQRVKLLPMRITHVDALFTAGNHPAVWTYLPLQVKTLEEMEGLVHAALEGKEKGIDFPFVVLDIETNELVGSTRFLDISERNRNLEIGWTWYSPTVWRSRVNTECKYLLLKYCFETLHTVRVQLKADNRNERSKQAIQRIGAKPEGILRNDRILANGFLRDSAYFSVLSHEWLEVKERLEGYLR